MFTVLQFAHFSRSIFHFNWYIHLIIFIEKWLLIFEKSKHCDPIMSWFLNMTFRKRILKREFKLSAIHNERWKENVSFILSQVFCGDQIVSAEVTVFHEIEKRYWLFKQKKIWFWQNKLKTEKKKNWKCSCKELVVIRQSTLTWIVKLRVREISKYTHLTLNVKYQLIHYIRCANQMSSIIGERSRLSIDLQMFVQRNKTKSVFWTFSF